MRFFSEEVGQFLKRSSLQDYEIKCAKREFEKITDKSKKGLGYSVVPPPHPLIYNRPKKLDLSYFGLDEFKEPEFKGYGSQDSKKESNVVCDKKSDDSKENSDNSLVKEQVSKDTSSFVESSLNVDKETVFPIDKKVESIKPKNHEKPVKKSVRYAEMYRSQTPRGNQRNWNGQKSNQLGSDFVMYNKACFICGSFNHVQAQCKYHQRERMVYGNNYNRVNYNYTTKRTHPNAQRNMVPRAVLMKTGLKPFNTARTVNTAHPKSTVFSAKPMSCFSKTTQSTIRRPFQTKTTLTNKRFIHKVNTAKSQAVNTARPQAVNTVRPNSIVVNAVRVNQENVVKASAYWVWRPTKPDSASITLKKHNYIDARGRSKKLLTAKAKACQKRSDTKIPQSRGPPIKVGNKAVHKELGDRMERAATTASSLEAEQDSGSGPRGYTLGSGKDSMKLLELMELCTKLSNVLLKNRKSDLIRYALTVNPTIYTSCIEQFWSTAKAKTVNGERQIQALIDKKKVIITETSIRSDLHLEDAGGTDCLPTATIFEELARMGYEKPSQKLTFYKAFFSPQWKFLIHTITQCLSAKSTAWNKFSSTMASLIICLATNQNFNLSKYIFDAMVKHLDGGVKFLMYPRFLQVFINQQLGDMSRHKKIYVNPSHTKKIFANMRREGKDFSGRVTPLSQKKQSKRKQRKDNAVTQEETQQDSSVPTPSNDPPLSGEDSIQLSELMLLCTNLQNQVLDLEKAKDAQANEIADLKKRVQKLERKKKSRTTGLKRLRKVGKSRRVESSKDKDSLGDHEDASKQGRNIEYIDKDADVSLVDDTQRRSDDAEMFDTNDLHGDEIAVDMPVGEKQEQSAKEREVDTSVEGSVAPITIEEITLAQTLIQIKAAKPKVVTTVATTTTTTRSKARGVVVQEPSEFRTPQESQPSMIKDKGKAIMIKPKVPLKRKDQVALNEDLARNLQAQLEAELIEEERLARKKEKEANIALIESWDNTQAMMEADFELAQRLQTEEQGEITIEERSRLFVELINKRKKHFAMLRAEEKRRKPPTKAQKRNLMSTYLKNMGGYKHNQLKSKSYEEIQKLFDNEMRRVNTFIPMDSEVVKSKKETEESSKGTEDELESDKSKKAESSEEKAKGSKKKILEVKVDDEAELKKHLVIVKDDDIAINAIPLATKPPVIVEYKLLKEGILVHYQLIRADGSSKRYSSMIRMLQDISREDLETLWKLVKTKHGDTRLEDEHERVLWGDLKVMFEPDIKSDVWRNLQGYTVTI
ncbi:hypothetical protein Tco_1402529 [Tanacetum coccineum]